jgi:hypothetical protein
VSSGRSSGPHGRNDTLDSPGGSRSALSEKRPCARVVRVTNSAVPEELSAMGTEPSGATAPTLAVIVAGGSARLKGSVKSSKLSATTAPVEFARESSRIQSEPLAAHPASERSGPHSGHGPGSTGCEVLAQDQTDAPPPRGRATGKSASGETVPVARCRSERNAVPVNGLSASSERTNTRESLDAMITWSLNA